jgi:5'-deoxynucleotidase YfbR-like HD superfamily hydrolase
MMHVFCETHSGIFADLYGKRMLQPEQVDVGDIAHSLSHQCRYNGHCREFYSVAQHSVLVSRLLERSNHPARIVMLGLLHDAAEAYLGDITRPVKLILDAIAPSAWRDVEDQTQRIIESALIDGHAATSAEHAIIKRADNSMLMTEARRLMPSRGRGWAIEESEQELLFHDCWDFDTARRRFLGTYYRLARMMGIAAGDPANVL